MIRTVEVKLPPVDMREVYRYMGISGEADPALRALVDKALVEMLPDLTPRACFAELDVSVDGDTVTIGGRRVRSRSLSRHLSGASSVLIFAATVGYAPDRMVRKYERLSPAIALAADALGSERAEAACDTLSATLCQDFGAVGCKLTRRFSPGYGDLPLEFQRDMFDLLTPERRIGVTLGESFLMTPTKSVTAIIGIVPDPVNTDRGA